MFVTLARWVGIPLAGMLMGMSLGYALPYILINNQDEWDGVLRFGLTLITVPFGGLYGLAFGTLIVLGRRGVTCATPSARTNSPEP